MSPVNPTQSRYPLLSLPDPLGAADAPRQILGLVAGGVYGAQLTYYTDYYNCYGPNNYDGYFNELVTDRLYAYPLWVPNPVHLSAVGNYLWADDMTAIPVRWGIYQSSGGQPGRLLYDFGVYALGAMGYETSSDTNQALVVGTPEPGPLYLAPGLYWLAVNFDTYEGPDPIIYDPWHDFYFEFRGVKPTTDIRPLLGYASPTERYAAPGWYVDQAWGPMPDPFPAGGAPITDQVHAAPIVWCVL